MNFSRVKIGMKFEQNYILYYYNIVIFELLSIKK